MISRSCLAHLRRLTGNGARGSARADQTGCHRQHGVRPLATIAEIPESSNPLGSPQYASQTTAKSAPSPDTHVTTTVYKFPEMEPLRFAYYPRSHLLLPMRRDILHRAVIYEGDKTRQGTSSAKNRWEVHGSHRKLRQQKGTGKARVGDKQSPTRVGGGTSHGPKPRDFSTGLPRKVYDLAWRIALSYRYRRGQLTVVDALNDTESTESWYLEQIFHENGWGRSDGRSTLITTSRRPGNEGLFKGMGYMMKHGRIKGVPDVDVKNLLEYGRIVIEKNALDAIFTEHSRDLYRRAASASSELPPVVPDALGVMDEFEAIAEMEEEAELESAQRSRQQLAAGSIIS